MELDQIIENFLPIKIPFTDPATGEDCRVQYVRFIEDCIALDDHDFLRQLEAEDRNRKEGQLQASGTVYTRFIDFYGEPIRLNRERYPNAEGEFNQMFSANFFLLSYKYCLQQKQKRTVYKSNYASNQSKSSGCLVSLLVMIGLSALLFI